MFSPASVAKSYLEELHILHPSEKLNDAYEARTSILRIVFQKIALRRAGR
jgi:hypothetical protein